MITVRRATLEDCQLVWEWVNDPTVRAASFQTAAIPWEAHERWFQQRLADVRCRYFILLDGNRAVGQVRFEVEGQQAEVHISVASHERGRGYGRRALDLGCRIVVSECAIRRVLAHVKPGNFTSIRLFERAGFVHVGVAVAGGHPAERMAWEPHP